MKGTKNWFLSLLAFASWNLIKFPFHGKNIWKNIFKYLKLKPFRIKSFQQLVKKSQNIFKFSSSSFEWFLFRFSADEILPFCIIVSRVIDDVSRMVSLRSESSIKLTKVEVLSSLLSFSLFFYFESSWKIMKCNFLAFSVLFSWIAA